MFCSTSFSLSLSLVSVHCFCRHRRRRLAAVGYDYGMCVRLDPSQTCCESLRAPAASTASVGTAAAATATGKRTRSASCTPEGWRKKDLTQTSWPRPTAVTRCWWTQRNRGAAPWQRDRLKNMAKRLLIVLVMPYGGVTAVDRFCFPSHRRWR